jgi:DNA sulfur modification protein DndB
MIVNEVFSKRQSITTYKLRELIEMFMNGRLQLRDVNQLHVRAIKKYIFENAGAEQIYFPPIVANLEEGSLEDGKPSKLTVVDGSQRIKAFSQLDEMIIRAIKGENQEDIKKGYQLLYTLENTEIAVQIFENLTKEEADQMFIDLNTRGKKVALSKRIAYDSRNDLNQITNRVLQTNDQLKIAGVEMEKRALIRPTNKKLLSLSQLRLIVGIFLTGKLLHRSTDVTWEKTLTTEEYIELINCWFDELFKLYPAKTIGDYNESILAGFPMLVSVAFYANKGMKGFSFEKRKETIIMRMHQLQNVNWQRTNPLWEQFKGSRKGREKYFYLANDKTNIQQLVKWLESQRR